MKVAKGLTGYISRFKQLESVEESVEESVKESVEFGNNRLLTLALSARKMAVMAAMVEWLKAAASLTPEENSARI